MGKIRTEGIGEVQEFVDIVSSISPMGQARQFIDQPIGQLTVEIHLSYVHSVTMQLAFQE
jgi:hypothetical protein